MNLTPQRLHSPKNDFSWLLKCKKECYQWKELEKPFKKIPWFAMFTYVVPKISMFENRKKTADSAISAYFTDFQTSITWEPHGNHNIFLNVFFELFPLVALFFAFEHGVLI